MTNHIVVILQADSGGPLTTKKNSVIGIVSTGVGCGIIFLNWDIFCINFINFFHSNSQTWVAGDLYSN